MPAICLRVGVLFMVVASMWGSVPRPRPLAPSPLVAPPRAPQPRAESPQPTVADLQRRGTITFLMDHSAASYFLYRGEQMGFEFELARAFAKELGVTLEVLTPPPGIALTAWFGEGKGDVIAGLVTTEGTDPRLLRVSAPYLETAAQILTRSEESVPPGVADLAGKAVAVRPHSVYDPQLRAQMGGLRAPSAVTLAQSDNGIEEAVSAVVQGRAAATAMIAPLAGLTHTLYPGKLRTALTLATPLRLVWAVRPEQADLLRTIDLYLERAHRSGLKKILFEKYFVVADHLRNLARVPESTLRSKRLSRYDHLIARHAEEAGFDWRLIAALIFEESRFDHTRVSEEGAYGLMQIRPIAALEAGVKNYTAPHGNIEAGVKYLRALARQFPHGRPEDQLALVLASYLIGPGHVGDAQRLARSLGYNPHCWAESMEQALPLLEDPAYYRETLYGTAQGRHAVRYVNAVRKRYTLYSQYVSRDLAPVEAQTSAPPQAASAAG